MFRLITTLLSVILCWDLSHSTDQQLYMPNNPCPDIFEYMLWNDQYIGRITIHNSQMDQSVVIRFKQSQLNNSDFVGSIKPFEDEKTMIHHIKEGLPLTYHVDFPDSNLIPDLMEISVNEEVICEQSDKIHERPLSEHPNSLIQLVHKHNLRHPPTSYRKPRSTSVPAEMMQHLAENCGQEKGLLNLVSGGLNLQRNQSPWLAALYRKNPNKSLQFLCVGTLISSRTVITAAHCLNQQNSDQVFVYLGHQLLNPNTQADAETREVQSILIHPEYNNLPDADVALVQMTTPVSFTDSVRPVCLWNETAHGEVAGLTGTISGWGSSDDENNISNMARSLRSRIVTESTCVRSHAAYANIISSRTLCAGNRDGTGPCVGDSGAGLVIQHDGRWLLRGVISTAVRMQGRCVLTEYVVYCDVAKHLDWVTSAMLI